MDTHSAGQHDEHMTYTADASPFALDEYWKQGEEMMRMNRNTISTMMKPTIAGLEAASLEKKETLS
ncbi:hypothetical protein KSC_101360 [Ktedonobacter sp. SOSP1-52]|uniref:hypothetical protein n=1 Tax=Ktedonobacter sp. SOSP1-52 TaxID=2778366 RepID=UPI001914EA78|nr:hypothetical protein [Ktedonobacter sp. SOSP1-52]GHO71244.1 hypothetical protein KSC_101360 [Ktedonobacter sp. SOSP1-52]